MKLLFLILFPFILFAQDYLLYKDIQVYQGDYTVLSFEVRGDVRLDSLVFGVKADRADSTARQIQKENTAAGGSDSEIQVIYSQKSTVLVKLLVDDTGGLTPAVYVYDLTKDSTTLYTGYFTIVDDVTGSADGVATRTPYYTVALDTPNTVNTFIIGQDSTNIWYRRTTAATRTILGIDTITNATSLPDSIIYTSEVADFVTKSTTQNITAQKNFSGTVKFKSDSSFIINPTSVVPIGLKINQLTSHSAGQYDIWRAVCSDTNNADYMMRIGATDWIPGRLQTDFLLSYGYNLDGAKQKPIFGMFMESPYEVNANYDVYEWFISFQNLPVSTFDARPIQVGGWIARDGVSSDYAAVVLDVNQFYITDVGSGFQKFLIAPQATGATYITLMDTTAIRQEVNNIPWLYQYASDGVTLKELMRIDDEDEVKIAPNGTTPIKLSSPISGQIKWSKTQTAGTIPIEPDTTNDKLNLGDDAGIFAQKISVGYLPLDTTDVPSGEFVVDPTTGNVKYLIGLNLLTNGDFDNWETWGSYSIPQNWTPPDSTLGMYVEEDPAGRLHVVSDGSAQPQCYSEVNQVVGTTYNYSFTVYEPVDSFTVFPAGDGLTITEAGSYNGEYTATTTNSLFAIAPLDNGIAHEITLDNIRVWVKSGGAKETTLDLSVPDTTGVSNNFVLKKTVSGIAWAADAGGAGSDSASYVSHDSRWVIGDSLITDAEGAARFQPLESTLTDIADGTIAEDLVNTANPWADNEVANNLTIDDAGIAATIARDSEMALLYADTLSKSWGVMDTVTTGDYTGWKVDNNITITEVSAYTNTGTVTFNIEERVETTPNTAGVDLIGSDLVADTDQQETGTFSNALIDRDDWLVPTVTSISGDPTIFTITVRYVKTN